MTKVSGVNFDAQDNKTTAAQTDSIKAKKDLERKTLIAQILSGNSQYSVNDGMTKGQERDNMIDAFKAAGLWEGKENKDIRQLCGKKFGNFWKKLITGKDAKVYDYAKETASENRQEFVIANGVNKKFEKGKTSDKLEKAGYTDADVAKLLKDVAGNNTFDYSKENPEIATLVARLNQNAKGDINFTEKDAKAMIKAYGFNKEGSVNFGNTARAALVYGTPIAGIAAGIGLLSNVTQTADINPIANARNHTNLVAPFTSIASGAAAVATTASDITHQLKRNEGTLTDQVTDDSLKGYENYLSAKYLDKKGNKKTFDPSMYENLLDVAKNFYTNEDGSLNKDGMNLAIRKYGGNDSPLNRKEAILMRNDLFAGKYTPEHPQPCPETIAKEEEAEEEVTTPPATQVTTPTAAQVTTPPAAQVTTPPATPVKKADTDCQTVVVQNGESPAMIAKRYGVDINELLSANKTYKFTSNCGQTATRGFLVGQKIKLPAADCEKVTKEAAKNLDTDASVNVYNTEIKTAIKDGKVCKDDKTTTDKFYDEAAAA